MSQRRVSPWLLGVKEVNRRRNYLIFNTLCNYIPYIYNIFYSFTITFSEKKAKRYFHAVKNKDNNLVLEWKDYKEKKYISPSLIRKKRSLPLSDGKLNIRRDSKDETELIFERYIFIFKNFLTLSNF